MNTNRRTFLKSIGLFSILPAATTYSRIWKAVPVVETPEQFFKNPTFEFNLYWYSTKTRQYYYFDKIHQTWVPRPPTEANVIAPKKTIIHQKQDSTHEEGAYIIY